MKSEEWIRNRRDEWVSYMGNQIDFFKRSPIQCDTKISEIREECMMIITEFNKILDEE